MLSTSTYVFEVESVEISAPAEESPSPLTSPSPMPAPTALPPPVDGASQNIETQGGSQAGETEGISTGTQTASMGPMIVGLFGGMFMVACVARCIWRLRKGRSEDKKKKQISPEAAKVAARQKLAQWSSSKHGLIAVTASSKRIVPADDSDDEQATAPPPVRPPWGFTKRLLRHPAAGAPPGGPNKRVQPESVGAPSGASSSGPAKTVSFGPARPEP